MSIFSRNKKSTLASTAMLLVFGLASTAQADPISIVVTDKAAVIHRDGTTRIITSEEVSKVKAGTTGPSRRAWGVLVSQGVSAASHLEISGKNGPISIATEGGKAHGVQAGAKGSNANGQDKSEISLADNIKVVTTGSHSVGLHAIDGGTINSSADIETSGMNGFGIFAESYSKITQDGGNIVTTGYYGHALIANNDIANAEAGKVTAIGTVIETGGDWAHGAFADNGGAIFLDGAKITTEGSRAFGILAATNSTVSGQAAVFTINDKSHAVQAGANGSTGDGSDKSVVNLNAGSTVSTAGSDAFALHAIDGGTINSSADIKTSGKNGFGIFAESASTINQTGGSVTTDGGYGHGLIANDDRKTTGGKVVATDVKVQTNKDWSYGAFADNGGHIKLNGGSVTTEGDRSFGLLAGKKSMIISDADVSTKGSKAHGIQAGLNGSTPHGLDQSVITLKNAAKVTTTGNDAFGLHAIDGGKIDGTVNVTTSGINGFGVFAETFSIINLSNSVIETSGAKGYGIIANNDVSGNAGVIFVTDTVIKTTGKAASGVFVKDGGTVSLIGGTVAASGLDAAALEINGSGTLNIEGTVLKSAQGPTIFVTFSSAEEIANVTFGAGTVAVDNNGMLVNVARYEGGSDANMNITLKAGSEASGDIVDTDQKGSGQTHVNVEENAKFNGKISGIQDLKTESGTQMSFAEGTSIGGNIVATGSTYSFHSTGALIAGNVELYSGSSTGGGTTDTPITVSGNVLVDQTSFMGGNWDIGGDLTAQGTLRPGNSIGTVTVGGDVTFGADSVYEVEVAGNGASDRIDATGKASLQGGRLDVFALDNKVSYQDGQTYTILTAANGIEGTFSEAISKSIFLTTSLDHQVNKVDLKIGLVADPIDDVVFEKVAKSNNEISTARALDSLAQEGSALELYNSILFLTDEAEARDAFNQLSGDVHDSVNTGLIDTANLTADAINNRLRSAFDGVGSQNVPVLNFAQSPNGRAPKPFDAVKPASLDYGVWASGFGSWVNHDGNSKAGGLKTITGGFLSGVDVGLNSGWRLGVVGGYSQTDLNRKGRNASADSDNWHLGIYGGNQWGPIGLRAGLVHTWHSIDSSRSVSYSGFSDSLGADYHARTLQAFGELGYRIDTTVAAFEPFANFSHVRLHTDGFTERGGAAALTVDGSNTNTTFTTLGMHASAPLPLDGANASLKGTLGWRRSYGDITPESTHLFAGSNPFTVEGVAIARDAALVEAGFDMALTDSAKFGLSYVGQFGSGAKQNGFNATLNMKF